jgi:hypothetical protein
LNRTISHATNYLGSGEAQGITLLAWLDIPWVMAHDQNN